MGILGSGLACLTCAGTFFGNLPVGGGNRGPTRVGYFVLPTHSLRREVVGEGALRGRSPRTREGRIGPTAQKSSGKWLVVSGQRRRLTYFRVESGLDIVSLLQEVQESSPQYWDAPRGKHLFPRRTRRTASFVRGGRGGARRTAVLSAVEEREVSSGSKSSR